MAQNSRAIYVSQIRSNNGKPAGHDAHLDINADARIKLIDPGAGNKNTLGPVRRPIPVDDTPNVSHRDWPV